MASQVDQFFTHFQNMMDHEAKMYDPHSSQIIDSMEVLSFSLMLHSYMGFYIFLFQQPFISMMIYQAFAYGLSYSLFGYHFFQFIFHPFFRKHMKDIVLPQMLYTLFHLYILFQPYPLYITLLMNVCMYQMSGSYFHMCEHIESKRIRSVMNILIYFLKFFYLKMSSLMIQD